MQKNKFSLKTDQKKYVLKCVYSLLTEIKLIMICDDIYTIHLVYER